MVIRGVPVDYVIIDEMPPGLPVQTSDDFTRWWFEAFEWFQACGGSADAWEDLTFLGRLRWIESVKQLEERNGAQWLSR